MISYRKNWPFWVPCRNWTKHHTIFDNLKPLWKTITNSCFPQKHGCLWFFNVVSSRYNPQSLLVDIKARIPCFHYTNPSDKWMKNPRSENFIPFNWFPLWALTQQNSWKGLKSDPSKSPPAQQHFATVLDFHWIQKTFLIVMA